MTPIRRLSRAALVALGAFLPCLVAATVSISPSPSYTGSYTASWTDFSGGPVHAYLATSLNGGAWTKAAVTGTYSKVFTGKAVGSYAYKVQIYTLEGVEIFDYETPAVTVQVWTSIPAAPGAITGPASSESGNYALAWTSPPGVVTRYELLENNVLVPGASGTSVSLSGKPSGSYAYKVRACNGLGCGPYGAVFTVSVSVNLTTAVPDAAVVADAPLAQGWVGLMPGKAGTDGGAASYQVEIEVPPGRAGMQPAMALTYGSRNGNGVAGVGWSLSAGGRIYRCPRTWENDGGNGPVRLSPTDRLCMDGQRLVLVNGTQYGAAGSEYRTEVESFARITLQGGGMGSSSSYFTVEQKSGRVSVYSAEPQEAGVSTPVAAWNLAVEYDQQDNCIQYSYMRLAGRGVAAQWELARILYTGAWQASTRQCAVGFPARQIWLDYADRPDRRVTYQAGTGKLQAKRLTTISTSVGAQSVRRYELDYVGSTAPARDTSAATGRSLLRAVRVCAGAACGVERLPDSKFEYREQLGNFGFPQQRTMGKVPCRGPCDPGEDDPGVGVLWSMAQIGDVDGDGKLDQLLVRAIPGQAREPFISLDGGATLGTLDRSLVVDPRLLAASVATATDLTNDGRSDVISWNTDPAAAEGGLPVPVGALAIESYSAANGWAKRFAKVSLSPVQFLVLPEEALLGYSSRGGYPVDFDGDGLVDLFRSENGVRVVRRQIGRPGELLFEANPSISLPADPIDRTDLTSWRVGGEPKDFNGDGLMDVFHDSLNVTLPAFIDFYSGPGAAAPFSSWNLQDLGGPARLFDPVAIRRWLDVNGDGLPDIFDLGTATAVGSIWINQGGAPGPGMFKRVDVRGGGDIPARQRGDTLLADYDTDGGDELLVPTTRGDLEYCSWDLSGLEVWYCGDQHDLLGALRGLDRSLFHWDALRFREAADGSYDLVREATSLQAPRGFALKDWNGDGLPDVQFKVGYGIANGEGGLKITYGYYRWKATGVELMDEEYGIYYAMNGGGLPPPAAPPPGLQAPDLLMKTSIRVAPDSSQEVETRWTYAPLSSAAVRTECPQGAAPFYRANNDSPDRAPGDVFFTSSMWVVAAMQTSHGAGATATNPEGLNRTCYRYEDGMLNTLGRGFLGFRKIVAEEALETAAGEPGVAGGASPNNLRTTTVFNQEFPFTNTPRSVTVESVSDGRKLAEATTWWHAAQSAFGSPWVRFKTATTEKKWDPASGNVLAINGSVAEVDLVSGEPTKSCTVSDDAGMATVYMALPAAVQPALTTLSQETRVLTSDLTAWWLGKVSSSTKLVGPFTGSADLALGRAATTTGTTAAATCPSPSNLVASKVATTQFTRYPATDPAQQRRKLKWQSVTPAGATESESETTFTYGPYGNPLTKTVTARAVLGLTGTRSALTTTLGPSADGYFVETEANPLGHIATTRRDAATGQVVWQQEIAGGPAVTTTLDTLGRPLTTTHDGAQPVSQRTVACSALVLASAVTCGPLEVLARQTTQAGAPTKTEYVDLLGRVLRTATVALDGSVVVIGAQFNERGLKVAEDAPAKAGAKQWRTSYSGFDRLGRVTRKEVERSGSIFAGGTDVGPLVTTYTHTGHTTEILADSGGPVPLRMWRAYDARGRLVKTVQQVTPAGQTTRDLKVQYVYEPAGTLAHIVDPGGNVITALYDVLGRKKRVDDPDRGTWLYAWDGLGRLQFQTDARNRVTTQEYDLLGRPLHRSTNMAGGVTPETADWTYDLPGGQGLLGRETDSRGFVRLYTYDTLRRPTKVTTTIPAADTKQASGLRTFTMEYGYDRNHGRLKAMRFPSAVKLIGETVALEYDARGFQVGETALNVDYTRGKQYRRVLGRSERGQVTDQRLGNCVRERAEYDPSTGTALHLSALRPSPAPAALPADLGGCPAEGATTAALVRQDDYLYDRFLNLSRQVKNVANLQREERFTYDRLQRLLSAGRCTGAGCTPGAAETDFYSYDDLGNLTSKSDYGTGYLYGSATLDVNGIWTRATGNAGPHAARQVTKVAAAGGGTVAFTYDNNGNMLSGDGRTVDFDLMDRPVRVVMGGTTTDFFYAPGGWRYRQKLTGTPGPGFGPKTVYYVDKDYELTVWDTGSASAGALEERSFIGGSVVALTTKTTAGAATREVRYQHVDRLGSPEAVTSDDAAASLVEAHGFDPWGKPRGGDWLPTADRLHQAGEPGMTSSRGFTGHEHLDSAYLIHMNGRVYDYRLGRFLSVDPIISNPANSQSINPYSYIGNNPLSGTDPTGYTSEPACGRYASCTVYNYSGGHVPTVDSTNRASAYASQGSGAFGQSSAVATNNPVNAGGPKEVAISPATPFAAPLAPAGGTTAPARPSAQYDYEALASEAHELVRTRERAGFPAVSIGADGYEIPQSPPVTPRPEATAIGADLVITGGYTSPEHKGVDIRSIREPVLSMLPGVVTNVVRQPDGGTFGYTDVTTRLPSGGTVTWRYGHIGSFQLLGAEVGAGAVLGYTNLSGTNQLHLHLQRQVGPLLLLQGNPERVLDYLHSVRKNEHPWGIQ
jgi:RHS repeat-associated protein